jgi:hypothetical protein
MICEQGHYDKKVLNTTFVMASDDTFQRKMQTMMWCASIPNSKKKIENMKMIFVGGYAKFVPK